MCFKCVGEANGKVDVELFMNSSSACGGGRVCTGHYCYPGTTYSSARRGFPPEVGALLQLAVPI